MSDVLWATALFVIFGSLGAFLAKCKVHFKIGYLP
jgi:hypothetical protein